MRRHLNLRYSELDGVNPNLLSLDIYSPADDERHPVMVMIHGGAWALGDKADVSVSARKSWFFVSAGYVFVSVNYRLSPAFRHPTHVQDVARALAYVHSNVDAYGGDPARIYLMGHSAGAHLAALVATDESYLNAEGKDLSVVKGVVLLDCPGYDMPRLIDDLGGGTVMRAVYENAFGRGEEVWWDASARAHVAPGKRIPPFLMFHTGRLMAGSTLSNEFAHALAEAGVPALVVYAQGKTHNSVNRDIGQPGDGPTQLIVRFLADPWGVASLSDRPVAPPPP